jgi:hypothetical protein
VYVSEFLAYTTSVDESLKESKVKRIIWAILISAALAFGFASCDDGAAGGGRGWSAVGTWANLEYPTTNRITFKSDGTFEWTDPTGPIWRGTYEYIDIGLYLTPTWTSTLSMASITLEYNQATKELVWHPNSSQTIRYVRR